MTRSRQTVQVRQDKRGGRVSQSALVLQSVESVQSPLRLADFAIGSLVVAVRPADRATEAVPSRNCRLAAGDICYVVARPDTLQHLKPRGRVPEWMADDSYPFLSPGLP